MSTEYIWVQRVQVNREVCKLSEKRDDLCSKSKFAGGYRVASVRHVPSVGKKPLTQMHV